MQMLRSGELISAESAHMSTTSHDDSKEQPATLDVLFSGRIN